MVCKWAHAIRLMVEGSSYRARYQCSNPWRPKSHLRWPIQTRFKSLQTRSKLRTTGVRSGRSGTTRSEDYKCRRRGRRTERRRRHRPTTGRRFCRRSCSSRCWTKRLTNTTTRTCCQSRRHTWCLTTCTLSRSRTTCWWWPAPPGSGGSTPPWCCTNPSTESSSKDSRPLILSNRTLGRKYHSSFEGSNFRLIIHISIIKFFPPSVKLNSCRNAQSKLSSKKK